MPSLSGFVIRLLAAFVLAKIAVENNAHASVESNTIMTTIDFFIPVLIILSPLAPFFARLSITLKNNKVL